MVNRRAPAYERLHHARRRGSNLLCSLMTSRRPPILNNPAVEARHQLIVAGLDRTTTVFARGCWRANVPVELIKNTKIPVLLLPRIGGS